MFLGVYHHPAPADLLGVVKSEEVKDTWYNEAVAFASSTLAKSALWLRKLP